MKSSAQLAQRRTPGRQTLPFPQPVPHEFHDGSGQAKSPAVQAYELNFQPFLSKGDYRGLHGCGCQQPGSIPHRQQNHHRHQIRQLSRTALRPAADHRRLPPLQRPHHLLSAAFRAARRQFPASSADVHRQGDRDQCQPSPTTALLDHSVLANHALYDRFYFSTFATRGSENAGRGVREIHERHRAAGVAGLPTLSARRQNRGHRQGGALRLRQAEGRRLQDRRRIPDDPRPVQRQLDQRAGMEGGAGVDEQERDRHPLGAHRRTRNQESRPACRSSRMSLLNGGAIRGDRGGCLPKSTTPRTNDWNGYRELTEPELENTGGQNRRRSARPRPVPLACRSL